MQTVAIIGLGIMGGGMAANWLKKGFAVRVYNRTRAKADGLAGLGATVTSSPKEAASGADIVFAMVADDDASRSVWLGENGALAGAEKGAILIESSTLTPGWVRELAKAAAAKGCAFLDAPVGGSKPAAASGQLVFFVGGDKAAVEKARPALEAVSTRINHLGGTAAGSTWKLINNMMAAAQLAVLAEGLALAAKSGVDPAQAAELIRGGASASPIVTSKIARMQERNFADPDFALRLMTKDLRYASALAKGAGLNLAVIGAVADAFGKADAQGAGDHDMAAIASAVG